MIECTKFKTFTKGTLLGFADFYIPKMGLEINDCTVHMKDGRKWISFPSKPFEDEMGAKKYRPYIRFREKSHKDAFDQEALKAIDMHCAKEADPF